MYSKLFSRITESSLMEEPIPARYVFVMFLAISDPQGYVIGTDVAIARRINMPLREFLPCVDRLMEPDAHSNSNAEDGRRIIRSDGERGYRIVNYIHYRSMRDEPARREYMRQYMADYRAKKSGKLNGKHRKPKLAHAEEDYVNARKEHDDWKRSEDCGQCGHCKDCRDKEARD